MKIFGYSMTRNYAQDGSCVRCPDCGCEDLKETVKDRNEWAVLEYSVDCPSCGAMVAYWAHGSYDPYFWFYEKSLPALKDRILCEIRGVSTP